MEKNIFEKIRNFSALDERDCQAAWLFAQEPVHIHTEPVLCDLWPRNGPSQHGSGHNPLLGSARILKELISKILQNLKQASKSLS